MAADENFPWHAANPSKQSITELLHNPRASKLELPDVSSFELSSKSLSLNSSPPTDLPTPCDINHFESYLRKYAPRHAEFQRENRRAPPEPQQLHSVPSQFFETDFAPASSHHLLVLQEHHNALSQHPQLPQLRNQLSTYQTTLEYHLKKQLDNQSAQIAQSISNIRTLRQNILQTVAALRETRQKASTLIPTVTSPILAVQRLTQIQANLNALKEALNRVHTVANAPADVSILLDSGEYSAAIDTVANAKAALSHPHLSAFKALGPVRARLAQSVEQIDNALRQQFRLALMDNNELTLNHVVSLVNRMGRLPLLSRYFMREIKGGLTRELAGVDSLSAAAKYAKASASRAVLLVNIIHCGKEGDLSAEEFRKNPPEAWKTQMREAHADLDELVANVVDRMLGNWSVRDTLQERAFIVITPENELTAENCFDEFKAALRFGEEVRCLEQLAEDLEGTFFVEKRRSALRAKISEKQIAFLGAFHKAHVDSLTRTIRSDRWQEVRVTEAASRLLTAVVGPPTAASMEKASSSPVSKKGSSEVPQGTIIIGDEAFKTVATGVRYVRSMCAYSLLTEKSPTLGSEFGRRGNDFCRLFNSLVGKAILGAAALQWSALRSITARHLSLASRTIALAAALANHINRPLEEVLTGTQVKLILPLVKKSEKDLRDHHAQLLAKILAIMMDRLDAHEKTLKSLPWSKQQEMERFEIPSMYAVTLAKEASVLHRILWSVLPKREVFDIFQRVCAAYGTHLTEAYGALDGGEEWIRVRVANDVSCLHNRLRPLEVFKSNPASFKPLSRLYNRFAKDFFGTGTKVASAAKSKEARKSGTPLSSNSPKSKKSSSAAKPQSSESKRTYPVEPKEVRDSEDNSSSTLNKEISEGSSRITPRTENGPKSTNSSDIDSKSAGTVRKVSLEEKGAFNSSQDATTGESAVNRIGNLQENGQSPSEVMSTSMQEKSRTHPSPEVQDDSSLQGSVKIGTTSTSSEKTKENYNESKIETVSTTETIPGKSPLVPTASKDLRQGTTSESAEEDAQPRNVAHTGDSLVTLLADRSDVVTSETNEGDSPEEYSKARSDKGKSEEKESLSVNDSHAAADGTGANGLQERTSQELLDGGNLKSNMPQHPNIVIKEDYRSEEILDVEQERINDSQLDEQSRGEHTAAAHQDLKQ
ncbi:Vacuolar protein sorting-associated protein [Gracilaria domingensis]|nr:Vacuolar protein sorting-associated protein [Gracilaria domingensis]